MKLCLIGRYNESEMLTGPEKVAKRIFHGLIATGEEVVFLEYFFDGSRYGILQKLFGFEERPVNGNGLVVTAGVFPFVGFLLRFRPQLVHLVTFERISLFAFVLKLLLRFRIFFSVHGIVAHEHKYFRHSPPFSLVIKDWICEWTYFTFSDVLVFYSQQSIQVGRAYYRITPAKSVILFHGIDDVFLQTQHLSGGGPLKVVFVGGETRPEKGLSWFLDSLQQVPFPLEVWIMDEGEAENSFQVGRARVYRVQRLPTEQFAAFLAAKDVFVSASSYEPFGLAPLEAMGAGLVPIVTLETGMSKFVRDGESGFVIAWGDSQKCAAAMERLSANPQLLHAMKEKARETAKEFRWSVVAHQYLKLYYGKSPSSEPAGK